MDSLKKYFRISALGLAFGAALVSCKVEDPWVDATVAPVLVDIVGAPFGYPQEKDPAVGYLTTASKVKLSARLLELDKSNILNNKIGIDSIPVSGIKVAITMRTGAVLGEATSGADGMVSIEKTWAELGIAAPVKGSLARISWTGTYKGVAFTRFSQVQGK
jgi:hypothetical protein